MPMSASDRGDACKPAYRNRGCSICCRPVAELAVFVITPRGDLRVARAGEADTAKDERCENCQLRLLGLYHYYLLFLNLVGSGIWAERA